MTTRRFLQLDVFSAVATRGNPLAVVIDGEGPDDATLQRFAAWTNLSETTFLLPPEHPDADYRVRIFTPTHEMRFAGHPTLGSCIAWMHAGGVPRTAGRVVQECPIGLIEVDVSGASPAFLAPPTRVEEMPADDRDALAAALGIPADKVQAGTTLHNGPDWSLLELESADDVLAVDAVRASDAEPHSTGLIGRHPDGTDVDYEVRMFAPQGGMVEDPITGSLNAAIAHWLCEQGRLDGPLTIAQGTRLDRLGRVHVRPEADDPARIWIGGDVHVVVEGSVDLA